MSGRVATWVGLTFGPVLWAVNMQAGQLLPYVDCRSGIRTGLLLSLLAMAVSVAAGWIAWASSRATEGGAFAARVGAGLSLLFAFALLLQAAAGMLLTGCER